MQNVEDPETFVCSECHLTLSSRRSLRRHSLSIHQMVLPDLRPAGLVCVCSNKFSSVENITRHLHEVHDVNPSLEHKKFDSKPEFVKWKREIEKSEPVKFIIIKTERTDKKKVIYYHCNRSGPVRTRVDSEERRRAMKTQGSCKINLYCPARISATFLTDGSVEVTFCLTHFGHKLAAAHVPVPSPVKKALAEKIASEVPFDCILADVRKNLSGDLSRVHLLNNQDLKNLMRDFQLDCQYKLHSDDATSVEQWVEMERSSQDSESAVICYKSKGVNSTDYPALETNDFLLGIMTAGQMEMLKKFGGNIICMDSTHGLTGYGYEMTTLLVIDDFGEGFPCAFFISDRNDQTGIEVFLKNIKERVGDIKCKVFLSDMAENFYNAWNSIMGPCDRRLFCTWHVLRAWHKKICTLTSEKRETVSKMVHTLLTETDVNAFQRMLPSTIEALCNDEGMLAFGEYFKKYYANNCEKWAYCFRLNAGINTNMALERLHGTLKHVFLKGTTAKRMDKTINALMRMVNDKLFNKLIALEKGKLCHKVRELRKRHKASLDLSIDRVIPKENSEDPQIKSWSVFSATRADYYIVSLSNDACDCPIRCQLCNACYHKFVCTCIDYSVRGIMCKHVHLLCRFLGVQSEEIANKTPNIHQSASQNDMDPQLVVDIEKKEEDSRQIVNLLCKQNFQSCEEEKMDLMETFKTSLDRCDSKLKLSIVRETLRTMDAKLSAVETGIIPQKEFQCKRKIDVRKKIEPQRQFELKKKNKKRKFVKPTNEEAARIAAQQSLQ